MTETWCSLVEGLEQILLSPVSFAVNVMGSETPNLPKRSKEAESLKVTFNHTFISHCLRSEFYCVPGRKSGILRIQYGHTAAAAEISF